MITRRSIATAFVFAIATLLAVAQGTAPARAGVGEKYGTHDPHVCDSRKSPESGPIDIATATQYLLCEYEVEDVYCCQPSKLNVLADVDLAVGAAVDYVAAVTTYDAVKFLDANTDAVFYPIAGSYKHYTCLPADSSPPGQNCLEIDKSVGGACYINTSGDWRCQVEIQGSGPNNEGAPPPP